MSAKDTFMISDIDDSESDELSGDCKRDTINVPDQATNSDKFLDFDDQNSKRSESTSSNNNKDTIPKDEDKKNNIEKEDSEEDNFKFKSYQEEEDYNNKYFQDDFYNKDKEKVNVDNIKNDGIDKHSDENDDKEKNANNETNFSDKSDFDNEEERNENNNVITHENNNENTYEIKNKNEKNYSDDSIEEINDDINQFKKRKNKSSDVISNADESNDFADESNDFGDENNNTSDQLNKDDKNQSNDNLKNKEKNLVVNKNDSIDISSNNVIVEPPIENKDERPRPLRHRKRKKKIRDSPESQINEEENKEAKNQENNDDISKQSNRSIHKNKGKAKDDNQIKKKTVNHTIDEIANISINDGDYSLINQSNFEKVMSRMRKKEKDALDNGDYELAKKAQLATQSAIRYYNERRLLKHNENRACEIDIQLQATRNDIGFLKEHWTRVLENAKRKASLDLLQLRDEQDKKLKEFDDEYKKIVSDPENNLPIEYTKSSSTVLELKKKQSIYISTNNFKMAKQIKKEIAKLEEKEKNENFLRFQKKKIAERNFLIKKQDDAFAVRRDNWTRTIEGIKSVANYEIEHAKRSEKQLESKINQTNEFSTRLIRQQQQRSSSLQPKKKTRNPLLQSQSVLPTERENTKTINHTQFTIQRNAQKEMAQEFRQRAMINRIIYTNRVVPKVKKPVPMTRTRKQYARTPR